MTLKDFVSTYGISQLPEIEKVAHIFYFLSRTVGIRSFTTSDVATWFSDLDFAEPNHSRLRKKLAASRDFIKADQQNSFRLHSRCVNEMDNIYRDASFQELEVPKSNSRNFVNPSRIAELRGIHSGNFDLTKVIQLCEELNSAHIAKSHLSIIMLTRGLIDHVPPLFGAKSFAQVASSYAGAKSFKESMQNLENSSRSIADSHLHGQIRKKEVLPNFHQVDFSNDIDVLLAEIVRILK